MKLSTNCLEEEQRGPFTVLVYALQGDAVVDSRIDYRVGGRAVLDVATRAFLDIECQLEQVDPVAL
ncbi:hypothetical protein [Bradyrhizobium viridifuturi]|uniref:hypothetical protein n=1 Tax=Bradyrhizobium viridifuturi TaxID=1654716 RepID=UPI000FE13CE8|nr:hypothetical protein [Bradyrhizobium viridifuturi]